MLTFLAFGTLWYWLFLSVAVLIGIICVEATESGGGATVTLIISLVLFGNIRDYRALLQDPSRLIVFLAIYFAAGIGWSLLKWYFFVRKSLNDYLDKTRTGDMYFKPSSVAAWQPQASQHKGDIIRWMSYWPLSIVGTMFTDVISKLWNHIFYAFRNLFQKISDHVFASALAEAKNKDVA
jgi:hypothetical protein